jgi:tRNA-2-methylthio-N6-dimethylallyladenosine synthase
MQMKNKYLNIKTIGCQMNVYDSGIIRSDLSSLGYTWTDNIKEADLVIVNTCTIREKAEQKAFSFLGRLAEIKRKKPGLMIGLGGCLAQQEAQNILKRAPYVDIIFGTNVIGRLSELITRAEKADKTIVDVDLSGESRSAFTIQAGQTPVSDYVTIMRGCDNYCTYCVVPYVRGRETSRLPEDIIDEIKTRVKRGMKEVTLLGQNVNSYGKKEGLLSFSELLTMVNNISGLHRIRFTTSHPKDLSLNLIHAFRDLENLCNHIHLPVQSGSNRILKKMNRKYTREEYLQKVESLRAVKPDITITSDMIVGFPGETEEDFEHTLDLMKTVEFDGLFAFAYSDRQLAPASSFGDKIEENVKRKRLLTLLDLQEEYTRKKNKTFVNKTVTVLVEGMSRKNNTNESVDLAQNQQWSGRTTENKIVNFTMDRTDLSCNDDLRGRLINVKIEKAFSNSLKGKPVIDSKGEITYAA